MSDWNKYRIKPDQFHNDILKLVSKIPENKYTEIYAIPRGGLSVGVYLSHYLDIPLRIDDDLKDLYTKNPEKSNILIVDDLVDTGITLGKYDTIFDTAVVYYKPRSITIPTYYTKKIPNERWIVFPYEKFDEKPNRGI
jgi:hypoxanthine phosphoribosyltransferase